MGILLAIGRDASALTLRGADITLVEDGVEALEQGKQATFALIILAGALASLESKAVCQALRVAQVNTPILLLVAGLTDSEWVAGLEAGADVVMDLNTESLIVDAQVRALLWRYSQARNPLRVGDLRLDIATHRVERAGVPIALSTTEYRLLFLLMSQVGQVISRTEIMKQVWPAGEADTDNVLDVYISYLRSKVDRPFDIPLIQTVRGQGYRLRPPAH